MYRHFSGIGRIICSAIPLFLALVVTSSYLYSQTETPPPPTGSGNDSTDEMLTPEGTEAENATTVSTEEPKTSTEALTATESITTALSTTSEPTPAPLPDIVVYDSCTEMPEGSYQREQCLRFVAQYGTVNGAKFFQKYVLVNKTDVLDETISGFYDNDEHKENGLKPRTVFFFDRRRGNYSTEREVEFEASFALVGLRQGNLLPVIRTSGEFHRINARNVMIEVDHSNFDDDELEMMVIQGVRLNANFRRARVATDLHTTIATDEQVRIKNVIVADNEFIDDRNPGGEDHDEHILIGNAVGNVSIVNNQFRNGAIEEKAVEIRCGAGKTQICNTNVIFSNNRVTGSGVTSALRLIDIPRFTIASNKVIFGSQSGGNSADAVFEVIYEDLGSCIGVFGFIHNNALTEVDGASYNAVSIVRVPDDELGVQAGTVYYANNLFEELPVVLDTRHLPDIELVAGVPDVLATTLPITDGMSSGVVQCENQCGVSAEEAVGFTFLTIAEAAGAYEVGALLAFMGNHWGHTAKQIPTFWNYVTLGAVYALKRWGPIASGNTDQIELVEK